MSDLIMPLYASYILPFRVRCLSACRMMLVSVVFAVCGWVCELVNIGK